MEQMEWFRACSGAEALSVGVTWEEEREKKDQAAQGPPMALGTSRNGAPTALGSSARASAPFEQRISSQHLT